MTDDPKESPIDKIKEGVSVKELESFARKYLTEVFLIVAILIATLSSVFDFFTGPRWSLIFAGIGCIISIAFPTQILKFEKPLFRFLKRQDNTTQIIAGVVRIIFSIFIPFIIFLEMGILAGLAFHFIPKQCLHNECKPEEKKEENTLDHDEEHI